MTFASHGSGPPPPLSQRRSRPHRPGRALQQYAATHNVKMVVALIGANDYGFADIVQQCVTDWLTSPSWWKNYCHDDSSMTAKFTAATSPPSPRA